jgi:hypothetical protein
MTKRAKDTTISPERLAKLPIYLRVLYYIFQGMASIPAPRKEDMNGGLHKLQRDQFGRGG